MTRPLPRGIAPELLVSQVRNTMPYLFEPGVGDALAADFPPAAWVRELAPDPGRELGHFEYFRLCVSAHYLSCGTPVPTDVDNQIRHKLWPAQLPLETALQMAGLVLESRAWDFTLVSRRFTRGAAGTPWEKETLSGHNGEWFTIACGAYCALKQYSGARAEEERRRLLEAISSEISRHSEVFGSLWRAGDGLGSLKASASVAHNFGDLDRVMDMWDLAVDDPLRLDFYKLGVKPFDSAGKLRYLGRLWVAGELYKSPIDGGSAMALENHRHFALRKPRCLRESPELLIPTGPFFHEWGRTVARRFADRPEALTETIEALRHGWERLPKSVGYLCALRGVSEIRPDLHFDDLMKHRPARVVLERDQQGFEKKWAETALRLMDEIPSRAE